MAEKAIAWRNSDGEVRTMTASQRKEIVGGADFEPLADFHARNLAAPPGSGNAPAAAKRVRPAGKRRSIKKPAPAPNKPPAPDAGNLKEDAVAAPEVD